jgi:hypothetical protein
MGERGEMYAILLVGNMKGRDLLKHLGVDGRIVLKRISKNYSRFEFDNESPDSIKGSEFPD